MPKLNDTKNVDKAPQKIVVSALDSEPEDDEQPVRMDLSSQTSGTGEVCSAFGSKSNRSSSNNSSERWANEKSPQSITNCSVGSAPVDYLRVKTKFASQVNGMGQDEYNTPEARSEHSCSTARNYPKFS